MHPTRNSAAFISNLSGGRVMPGVMRLHCKESHMRLGMVLSLILSPLTVAAARQVNSDVFYVESWKKGEVRIQEPKLVVELSARNSEYQKTINDSTGGSLFRVSKRKRLLFRVAVSR
jgi:hypothetical protein